MTIASDRLNFIAKQNQDWVVLPALVWCAQSQRGGDGKLVGFSDLVVMPREQWRSLQTCEAIIEINQPAAILVIEVVSKTTKSTDYRAALSVLNIAY